MKRPPAIFLLGPTAAGKTGLAVELVQRLPCDIISVDSAMVYQGMDIGTAKPDAATLAQAPHRLIDIIDPREAYSAARFRADALHEMAAISMQGRIPLLVGGTGLYFLALERGLSDLPAADAGVREELQRQARELGNAGLHRCLAEVDPESAARIHPNDPQRVQRALEVYRLSGRPLSELQRLDGSAALPWRVIKLGLAPADRAILHERIRARFLEMLTQGLVDEVAGLRARGDLSLQLPSMRVVGYRQVWQYLDGLLARAEMLERGVIATRQLAKRQITWLRGSDGIRWFDSEDGELYQRIRVYLEAFLNS